MHVNHKWKKVELKVERSLNNEKSGYYLFVYSLVSSIYKSIFMADAILPCIVNEKKKLGPEYINNFSL